MNDNIIKNAKAWITKHNEFEGKCYITLGGDRYQAEKLIRQYIQDNFDCHISIKRISRKIFKKKNGKLCFSFEKSEFC